MNIEMKTGGYAIYAPPALRKFLEARATGTATKEMLASLSDAAMAEQQENLSKLPKAPVIDFASARRERTEPK